MIASAQTLRILQPLQPFVARESVHGVTLGCGPAGYDIRIAETLWLWPRSYRLASAMEYFAMPTNLLGVVHDKSTWARRKVTVQNTVLEPGWRGYLTLELANHSYGFRRIMAGTAIAQVIFHFLDHPTDAPYGEDAKYQDQASGPQPARFQ